MHQALLLHPVTTPLWWEYFQQSPFPVSDILYKRPQNSEDGATQITNSILDTEIEAALPIAFSSSSSFEPQNHNILSGILEARVLIQLYYLLSDFDKSSNLHVRLSWFPSLLRGVR